MLAAELLSAFDQLEKEGSDTFLGAISEADLEGKSDPNFDFDLNFEPF